MCLVPSCRSSQARPPPFGGLSRPGVRPASAGGCWLLADDLDAHAPGGALDLAHRALDVVGVEVGHLDAGDLADLVTGDPADAFALGCLRALLDAGCLAQQVRGRRGLEDERERAV